MARFVCMLLALLACTSVVLAKGEYNSAYLYTEVDEADAGGIQVTLVGEPLPTRVIAVGRRTGNIYLGHIADGGKSLSWKHLPVDVYDLLLVGDAHFHEGLRLARRVDPEDRPEDDAAVRKEMAGIEAFFDRKTVHRLEFEGETAHMLVQQWREATALAESGAKLTGTIHSIDIFRFVKPAKGWQSPERRQLYREEINNRKPLQHVHVEALGGFRVTARVVTREVTLPAHAE